MKPGVLVDYLPKKKKKYGLFLHMSRLFTNKQPKPFSFSASRLC